jgi:hypothetical protein
MHLPIASVHDWVLAVLPVFVQLEALRQQQEAEQEGWRAAIAERARREVAEREAALRDRMARERDQQIEVGHLLVTLSIQDHDTSKTDVLM